MKNLSGRALIFLLLVVLFPAAPATVSLAAESGLTSSNDVAPPLRSMTLLTNVTQLHSLSSLDMNRGCPFSLNGIVTFVDTNRNFFVLQDATGAMAIYPNTPISVRSGELILLTSPSGVPFVVNFPDYPYRRAGWNIQSTFEAPANWGDFHLTRMSGFLHPPATGEYTFWIASDNSSELWLSSDDRPTRVRRIAYQKPGIWVNPYEWFRYATQRSDPIFLRAGHTYYIEAFHEQLTVDEHLEVAWQGPDLDQTIIDGKYMTPWSDETVQVSPMASGILREYWTNFALGNLTAIASVRPVESALTARGVHVEVLSSNVWPEPQHINLGQQLARDMNYRWVEAEGTLNFIGVDGDTATLELNSGPGGRAVVYVKNWKRDVLMGRTNWQVRVEGVCEGAYNSSGELMPGVIWADAGLQLSFFQRPRTNDESFSPDVATSNNTGPALGGFFSVGGVVTFNDRVLGKDCLFVQDANNAGVFVSQSDRLLRPQLRVGEWVELGGDLLPSKNAPRLNPLVVNLMGTHTLPEPVIPSSASESGEYRDAQWTELEGIVRVVQSDGTVSLRRKHDSMRVWIGKVTSKELGCYLDSVLRVRGVVSLETHDVPMLLVPSRSFVEEIERAPALLRNASVAALKKEAGDSGWQHRLKISGAVTYRDDESLFVQDDTGGVQVLPAADQTADVGDLVEITGFPETYGSTTVISEALVHKMGGPTSIKPVAASLAEPVGQLPNQILVEIKASLFGRKTNELWQVLELQSGQHVFEAILPISKIIPAIPMGSLLNLTGVCVTDVTGATKRENAWEKSSTASMHLLLRDASDVLVLRGPPWWTWKRTAWLIAVLMTLLLGVILRSYLVGRRFARQHSIRLAFARQLLQTQESERRRIAANLHDSLGQNLLAIKNQAHLALQSTSGNATRDRRLEDISQTALLALDEVRQITHDLRPYQLDRLGLTQAIRALIRRVSENCPIAFATHVDEIDGAFEKESEINIYRIVQESLNNVVKHSRATEATVVVKREDGVLTVSIRDNGLGMRPDGQGSDDSFAGFGLEGIRERACIMGGTMEVEAPAGGGFILKVEIPAP